MIKDIFIVLLILGLLYLLFFHKDGEETVLTEVRYDSAAYYRAQGDSARAQRLKLAEEFKVEKKVDSLEIAKFKGQANKWKGVAQRLKSNPEIIELLEGFPLADSLVLAQDSVIVLQDIIIDSLEQDMIDMEVVYTEQLVLAGQESLACRMENQQYITANYDLQKENKKLKRQKKGILALWGIREIVGIFTRK